VGGGFVSDYKALTIGKNVWISKDKQIQIRSDCQLLIGDNTEIGSEVMFLSDTHEIGDKTKRAGLGKHGNISVGTGCWIGARVTILPNTYLGNGVVIAAGSVVFGTFPDNVMIAGIPAKIKKELNNES
jgi:maltose O-acetyltransferase